MKTMTPEQLQAIRERAEANGQWDEIWMPIPGFPAYEVSDMGHVRSYLKKGNHSQKTNVHPRLLKQSENGNGYPTVAVPRNGKYVHRTVHSLVALTFMGERPKGMEVAHLNGNRKDNRVHNLKYVTHIENEAHKRSHATDPIGERNGASSLLGWQVAEIRYLSEKSIPQGKIAALFGINHKHVSEILSDRSWQHISARQDVPDLLAHIAELEAKASGWQPIETAPKDGEGVLLWSPQYGVCHAFWNEYARGSRGGWLIVHDNGDGWGAVEPNDATHWQPLPAPPAPTPNEKA